MVHNRYRSAMPSGENRVVDEEVDALRAAGVEVDTYFRSSDEFDTMGVTDRARALLGPLTGAPSLAALRASMRERRPDVVHLHNPYPLISPRVIDVASDAGVPVVATIHNFRLRCMNGLLFRDGASCTRCEQTGPWPGVRHACYRGSRAQSAVMAAALVRHRRSWERVTRFVAVSEFVAERLESWGVPRDQIVVKPNPVPDPGPPTAPGEGFLFAGRLSPEKGIRLLLDAWEASGLDGRMRLVIAGDGELRDEVARRCRALQSVEWVGRRSAEEIVALRQETAVAVVPSLWFEAHPALAESFAAARPVIATRVGALATLVDPDVGWLCEPCPKALGQALLAAAEASERSVKGARARERFERCYAARQVTARLIEVYDSVRR